MEGEAKNRREEEGHHPHRLGPSIDFWDWIDLKCWLLGWIWPFDFGSQLRAALPFPSFPFHSTQFPNKTSLLNNFLYNLLNNQGQEDFHFAILKPKMDSLIFIKLLAAFAFIQFTNSHEAYHDDSAPGCGVLNYEKVDSFPEEIDVKGIRLRILGQIQHGATSRVFHALHVDENGQKQCVAVKVVDMSRIEQHMQNQVTNEAQMLSELNEKKVDRIPLLFALENHPEKQTMSMVLELAHHDLFDEITPKMGRGKHGWVRRTFRQILGALEPVHQNDIIHGDLKPENMAYFLTPQGQLQLKVIDFGGAFRANTVNEACKQIVTGTVLYMSPEQVAWCSAHGEQQFEERQREFPLSRKSDVWSIGIILYQMLFGRNPYHWVMQKYEGLEEPERTDKGDKELRIVIFDGEKPIEFGEYEDGPMLEILKRCLDRNPEKRPEVPELMAELDKLGKLKRKLAKLEEQMDEYEKELKEMEGKIEGEKGLKEDENEEEDEEYEDEKNEEEKKTEDEKLKEEKKVKEEEQEKKVKEEEEEEEEKKMKEDKIKEEEEDEEKTKEDEGESEEQNKKEKMKEQIREIEEQIEKKKEEEVKNKFEKILGIGKKVENVDKGEMEVEEVKTLAKNVDEFPKKAEIADKDEKAEEIVKVAIGDKNPAFIFHVKNIRRAIPASMK